MPVSLDDYPNFPYSAVREFEQALSSLTGAPYAIATDSCTHALELSLRLNKRLIMNKIILPARTYISVPMTLHKLDIPYRYKDFKWFDEYQLTNTNIWDSARRCQSGMYMPGQIQCLSFGHGKPLEIGRGGAILLDDLEAYNLLKRMTYDGRDLAYVSWEDQKYFAVGYHYMMRPEEAIKGLNIIADDEINALDYYQYPDLRKISIV